MKPKTTQQINAYIRNQQVIIALKDLSQTIKKADISDQEASAFRKTALNLIKVSTYQPTHGVNQYATV